MFRENAYKLLILVLLSSSSLAEPPPPLDAAGWFELAQNARQEKRLAEAHDALDLAETQEFSPIRISFERARLYTLAGDSARAVTELEGVASTGFTSVGFIENDPILSTLAGNERYDELVETLSKVAYPCQHDERFSEFDFWIGDWVVHGPAGGLAGTNSITREEKGCVLLEHWSNVAGGTGQSINYVDKISGEWVQVWNSEGGSQINIRGGMTDEGMLLVGTLHTVGNGTTIPFRALWTPLEDGRVRQFFEQSSDEGQTWTTWFEGFYTRTE
jgi:hypothetical protein